MDDRTEIVEKLWHNFAGFRKIFPLQFFNFCTKSFLTFGVILKVNVDAVPALNRSHTGLWECHIEQEDLGFKWITNAILVEGNFSTRH